MNVIDIHAHAFPDEIAGNAIPALEAEADVKAVNDGTVGALLRSMDEAGIGLSVICSIATRPKQFEKILEWSKSIRSERLEPLPSVHPEHADAAAQIHRIADEGFRGVKLHPYYQQFRVNEPRMDPLYAAMQERKLLLVCHCGYDIAFPRDPIATPEQILDVVTRFPSLKLISTHMGAWEDWDEVERLLIGRSILMELSYSIPELGVERARRMLMNHPADCILFGTDTPWASQKEELERVAALDLPPDLNAKLLRGNAARLLGLPA